MGCEGYTYSFKASVSFPDCATQHTADYANLYLFW